VLTSGTSEFGTLETDPGLVVGVTVEWPVLLTLLAGCPGASLPISFVYANIPPLNSSATTPAFRISGLRKRGATPLVAVYTLPNGNLTRAVLIAIKARVQNAKIFLPLNRKESCTPTTFSFKNGRL
jgi:hypothetical protein